jgi:hypothetical protein
VGIQNVSKFPTLLVELLLVRLATWRIDGRSLAGDFVMNQKAIIITEAWELMDLQHVESRRCGGLVSTNGV